MDEKDGYGREDMTPGDNTALYDVKLLESLKTGCALWKKCWEKKTRHKRTYHRKKGS